MEYSILNSTMDSQNGAKANTFDDAYDYLEEKIFED